MGFLASASVLLSLELVRAAEQVSSFPSQDDREVTLLRQQIDLMKHAELEYKALGQKEMLTYGMLMVKSGKLPKGRSWQVRSWRSPRTALTWICQPTGAGKRNS